MQLEEAEHVQELFALAITMRQQSAIALHNEAQGRRSADLNPGDLKRFGVGVIDAGHGHTLPIDLDGE